MSLIVKAGKAAKRLLKSAHILPEEVPHISYARRIERVNTSERICAMTFDDGPMDLPAAPDQFHGRALTELLLDALSEFGAKGTFDVIGDTGLNYPDKAGRNGSAAWGGIRFDHYPDIHQDEHGGAVHNDRIIRRMLAEGHQITNHGYRHILFGKKPFVYGRRVHYGSVHSAVGDLKRLDAWMKENYGYDITMGRPPHYVDGLNGGFTSYDVYDRMGYQYLAASFDGGGWLPSGKRAKDALEAEIVAMTSPIRAALVENPDFFCGQIIFQKDGYNMSRRTPVAWGLPLQLEILHQYKYRVVTVEQLMEACPFTDVDREHPLFEKMARLAKRRGVAYSDNRLRLENHMTMGELAMLLAPKEEAMDLRWACMRRVKRRVHPYYGAVAWCKRERILPRDTDPDAPVTELPFGIFDKTKTFTRRAVYEAFREDWLNQGEYQEAEIRRIEEQLHGWAVPTLPPTSAALDAPEAAAESVADEVTVPVPDAATEPVADEVTARVPDAATELVADEVTLPVPETAAESVADEVTVPVPDAATEPVADEVTVPVPDAAAELVADEVTVPVPEAVTEPVADEVTARVPDAAAEPVADEVTARVPDAAAELVADEVTVPVPDAATEPVADEATVPVPDAAAELVADEVTARVPDAVTEPVADEVTARVPDAATELVADEVTVPVPDAAAEPVADATSAETQYVQALAEVYTEDSADVHKIRNLPHVDDIPHVDGIPHIEEPPAGIEDLFPEAGPGKER